MTDRDFDLFAIGAGSGGVRAARFSAQRGARVAVAEERYLGGTCVNVGCVPKKLFMYASHFRADLHEASAGYGWTIGETNFDWPTLRDNKTREIERLNGIYEGLLRDAGVQHFDGRATIVDAHSVEVAGQRYTAENILVATGGWPTVPEIPGVEWAVTSNELFSLDELPRKAIVVGGGYIAVEFACIFDGLGVDVTQLYRGPLFLRGFDGDVRRHLAEQVRLRGIDLRLETNVTAIEKKGGGIVATLTDGSALEADLILFATGRHPNVSDLGLEEAGVEMARDGSIRVDAYSRTNVPSIWAIGDVTNRINLTPVAIHEGVCLSETLFNDNPRSPDHENVPAAVFSQPPVGTVGLTEEEARERYSSIDVYRSVFRALKQTLTGGEERTLMKLIVDRETDRVIGLHMVGPEAGEIIQGFAVAIKAGATKADFDATIGVHPTSAEEFVTMRTPIES
ncbi:MAG: glutathione-disulfide reductase [bacterium]|nr:glutathione-disulfide reductase [Deltaproteobacteria bacterium]MCP4903442.1 glutathione-disulfide reductase [bacterium]